MAEHFFGKTITNSSGRVVPVRFIGEQHVMEDCGWIPTVADWLTNIQAQPWMKRVGRQLSKELEKEDFRATTTPAENAVRECETAEVG